MNKVLVFGVSDCPGCVELLALLIRKSIKYDYYNVKTKEGLTILASYGLADEEMSPVVTDEKGNLLDFDKFVAEVEQL